MGENTMQIKYEIVDKKLKIFATDTTTDAEIHYADFKFPIRQVLAFVDCLVVRIEPDSSQVYNENVFGINKDGKLLWQIQSIPHVYANSPYTNISKDGVFLKIHNWDGTDLTVEPYSGKITKKDFSR